MLLCTYICIVVICIARGRYFKNLDEVIILMLTVASKPLQLQSETVIMGEGIPADAM